MPRALSAAFFFVCLVALPACSSETQGVSSTGPSPTAPEGAVNMEVYATPEQTCPPGNFHVDIGNTKVTPPALLVSGEGGVTVTCAVVSQGAKYQASGAIKQGSLDFSFQDVLTSGGSATGTVSFVDPKGSGRYTSVASAPCVFQFAPSSAQGIGAGQVFVQFDCAALVNEADATKSCSSRYGYVALDRCAAK